MEIKRNLIQLILLASLSVFSGCYKQKEIEEAPRPTISGSYGQGEFIVTSEATGGTGMRTSDSEGEKIYTRILEVRFVEPETLAGVVIPIRSIKTENEGWHDLFYADIGNRYVFSKAHFRMESSHGGSIIYTEDFTDLRANSH